MSGCEWCVPLRGNLIRQASTLDWEDEESAVIGSVRNYSPAEDAGLQAGDEVVSLGGKNIKKENWLLALSRYKEGSRIPIVVKRDRRTIRTTLVLGPPERYEYRIEELPTATPQQRALREAWLNWTVKFVFGVRRPVGALLGRDQSRPMFFPTGSGNGKKTKSGARPPATKRRHVGALQGLCLSAAPQLLLPVRTLNRNRFI